MSSIEALEQELKALKAKRVGVLKELNDLKGKEKNPEVEKKIS